MTSASELTQYIISLTDCLPFDEQIRGKSFQFFTLFLDKERFRHFRLRFFCRLTAAEFASVRLQLYTCALQRSVQGVFDEGDSAPSVFQVFLLVNCP